MMFLSAQPEPSFSPPAPPQIVLKAVAHSAPDGGRFTYRWQVCTLAAGEALIDCEHGPFASREVALFFAARLNEAEAKGLHAASAVLRRALALRDAASLDACLRAEREAA